MKVNNDRLSIAWIGHGWDNVLQRPHHWQMQASLKKHHFSVYTISSPLSRRDNSTDCSSQAIHRLPFSITESLLSRLGVKKIQQRKVSRFEKFVRQSLIKERHDLIIYAAAPTANLDFSGLSSILIYDCMDEWSAFSRNKGILDLSQWEQRLASQADLIIAVSKPLFDKFVHNYGGKVVLIPNGCDYARFSSARNENLNNNSPIIGYTGTVDDWFNWSAVEAVARAYPKITIQLVGPVKEKPEVLPDNIILTGRQPYTKTPFFNAKFEVGIIPFLENSPLVAATSPIKLYEYLASGIPVVSSPMPDSIHFEERGIVHIARTSADFVREIEAARYLSKCPELIMRRQTIAEQNSWSARWQIIEEMVGTLLNNKRRSVANSVNDVKINTSDARWMN